MQRSSTVTLPSYWFQPRRGSRGQGVWPFYDMGEPHQAGVSTVKEAVKQLIALVSTGPDWPYALV